MAENRGDCAADYVLGMLLSEVNSLLDPMPGG
jgi:hypothetical protein